MLIFSRSPWAFFRSHTVFSSSSIGLNEFKLSYYSNYITFSSKKSLNLKIACAYMLNINQSSQERDLLTNWFYSMHSRHFLHHDIRFREMINIQLSRYLNRLQIHSLYFRRKKIHATGVTRRAYDTLKIRSRYHSRSCPRSDNALSVKKKINMLRVVFCAWTSLFHHCEVFPFARFKCVTDSNTYTYSLSYTENSLEFAGIVKKNNNKHCGRIKHLRNKRCGYFAQRFTRRWNTF